MDRRHFIGGSAAAAATLAIRPGFAADAYPSHAITFINPFPPGGAADVVGRPLTALLEPSLCLLWQFLKNQIVGSLYQRL